VKGSGTGKAQKPVRDVAACYSERIPAGQSRSEDWDSAEVCLAASSFLPPLSPGSAGRGVGGEGVVYQRET